MRWTAGLRDAESQAGTQIDRGDVTAELRDAACELNRDVGRGEHRKRHVDDRCSILGTARRQVLLVVRPERFSEPFVLPRTAHSIQPLRLLDDDYLD